MAKLIEQIEDDVQSKFWVIVSLIFSGLLLAPRASYDAWGDTVYWFVFGSGLAFAAYQTAKQVILLCIHFTDNTNTNLTAVVEKTKFSAACVCYCGLVLWNFIEPDQSPRLKGDRFKVTMSEWLAQKKGLIQGGGNNA